MKVNDELVLDATGQGVLVTGAAGGIGRRTATAFLQAGATVTGVDLEPVQPETAWGVLRAHQGDISDETFTREVILQISAPQLSTVVHCAGIYGSRTGLDTTSETWDKVLATNLRSSFLVLKYAIPILAQRGGGTIVLVGSTCGLNGGVNCPPAYAASKAGVHALTKWAAREYAGARVRVNAVAPGPIDTAMIAPVGVTADRVPLGRLGQPIDVARLSLFLASDAGSFVTGQIWSINGGTVI